MKFKVGDKVRLTREALSNRFSETKERMNYLLNGSSIVKIQGDFITLNGLHYSSYKSTSFELVPEEPRFEYGELIEVRLDEGAPWIKRPFIYFEKGNAKYPYITANITKKQFDEGKKFDFQAFKNARKLKAQLSRREIAEKFGVAEDFRLLD